MLDSKIMAFSSVVAHMGVDSGNPVNLFAREEFKAIGFFSTGRGLREGVEKTPAAAEALSYFDMLGDIISAPDDHVVIAFSGLFHKMDEVISEISPTQRPYDPSIYTWLPGIEAIAYEPLHSGFQSGFERRKISDMVLLEQDGISSWGVVSIPKNHIYDALSKNQYALFDLRVYDAPLTGHLFINFTKETMRLIDGELSLH